MPITEPPRPGRPANPGGRPRRRRPGPSGRRRGCGAGALLAIVLIALALVVGNALLQRLRPHLTPTGCTVTAASGPDVRVDPDQAANAATIAAVSVERRLPTRAAQIAIATAMQESKLRNLGHGDRDSLGLFQQRPSQGWGTAQQVQDPHYASERFYDHLVKVRGWQERPLTEVAQAVQRSGYPDAYARHEAEAATLAAAFTGDRPAAVTCRLDPPQSSLSARDIATALQTEFGVRPTTAGGSIQIGTDTQRGAAAIAAWSVAHAQQQGIHSVSYAGRTWTRGRSDAATTWSADASTGSGVRKVVIVP